MNQTLQVFSENVLNIMRGAQLMLFVIMCIRLYPKRKRNVILNHFFWLLIFMLFFLLFSVMGLMIDSMRDSCLFKELKMLADLSLVPLVGAYLLKVMIPEFINARKNLLLLSPNIILTAIHAYTQNRITIIISIIYTVLIVLLIFVLVVLLSSRYNGFLKKRFSSINNKTVDWVRVLSYVFLAWYIVWGIVVEVDNKWIDSVYYLFLILIWIFIYHYSVRHVVAVRAEDLFDIKQVKNKYVVEYEVENNISLEVTIDQLGQKLQIYIEEHHPWLKHSLTLQELATALGTNRTYLSDYINNRLNTTFYDYINSFRIRYACKLLVSEPESQLAYISEKSGFNSLSTFRRAFEKHIGTTPAKYRNRKHN